MAAKGEEVVLPVGSAPKPPQDGSDFIPQRIQLFDKLKASQDQQFAAKGRVPIEVTFPDKRVVSFKAWETTPSEIAKSISKSLEKDTIVARVNNELWDLNRPLEESCTLEFLNWNNEEAQKVYWHSSAHILGEAAEQKFGCHLSVGPPTDDGFFYEFGMPGRDGGVTKDDLNVLKKGMDVAIKQKQPFERLLMSKEDLLTMFKYNEFKQELIRSKIPDGTSTTVYRCGPLIDLCRGPHVVDTSKIKAFSLLKASASYFLGDQNNASLQRVYGVSYPDKKLLAERLTFLEEAAKRDHRKIGLAQELFFFDEMSPGSPFLLMHGMRIFNTLQAFVRSEYRRRDYHEVSSPNMFSSELWKTSGHWDHYKDDMFTFEAEKTVFGLKPMNCPGHCLIFGSRDRSYRELPLRMAEFGILHRNEASGALTGMTRVRRFIQDDSHIFCAEDQIKSEILDLFDFLDKAYNPLGMEFHLKLSTRPEKFLGDIKTWDKAEDTLRIALDEFTQKKGTAWAINAGDGAFYGPKIDITIRDALGRTHQCATIQLDFQLPRRFNLKYNSGSTDAPKDSISGEKPPQTTADVAANADEDRALPPGMSRPIIIHRAILGSFERFLAMLVEHFAGKWPFWLSPRQVLLVPVMAAADDYVKRVEKALKQREFYADSDLSGQTMNWKIRNGQTSQYNFIFVLGDKEMKNETVSVRARDSKGDLLTLPLKDVLEKLDKLRADKSLDNMLA